MSEEKLDDEQFSAAFRSRVGFVFQNTDAQVFSPTVREEIAFGPLQLGLEPDEVEARIGDVTAMLEIGDLIERAPYQLSAGQKKRVAIASVLAMNPELLLFDEPTAGLDPRSRHWLLELMVELAEAGKTIVFATHELDQLELDRRPLPRPLGAAPRPALPARLPRSSPTGSCSSRPTSCTSTRIATATLLHSHAHERGPPPLSLVTSSSFDSERTVGVFTGCPVSSRASRLLTVIRALVSSRVGRGRVARRLRAVAGRRPCPRGARRQLSLAGVLAALFAWLGPPGNDLAAHVYLRWEFLQHGLAFWSNLWYSGRYSYITYSPLYYPLAGLIGIRLLATLSIAAAALRLLGRDRTAVGLGGALVEPQLRGALGRDRLLGRLPVRARRDARAVCDLGAAISRPLALRRALRADDDREPARLRLPGRGLRPGSGWAARGIWCSVAICRDCARPALTLAPASVIGLLTWRMFPSQGRYPFGIRAAARDRRLLRARRRADLACRAGAAASLDLPRLPGREPDAVRGAVGGGRQRRAPAPDRVAARPACLLARGYRPRLFVAPVLALALFWNLGPIAEGFNHGRSDPGSSHDYWSPAITFLHENLTPSYRVEVVDTVDHWAAAYLPQAGIPITRGWFRQDDYPQNEVLYKDPTRRAYLAWLREPGRALRDPDRGADRLQLA